ncbi:MAG: hypothetical protein L0H71_10415 [Yaniella sp.]|uniref:hypothetical protein n=2 Tax=Yaniella sp. TaxID=2773929 RepID=UPI0026474E5B|nr:hypothetical protein [Yaniella sp.]MDN5815744.1 hypothetical protein [Yaniella sp.]MDN5913075.1 hypothetical protein [Yaniella sp.]MDN6358233.1 hypothetical protein [Yaniella sp.]MDN6637751.1 hypothetical protein [Yaniella sp.]
MRHLAFLRIYQPLEKLPARIQNLAQAATKLSRADIEAEAAERLNRRLRPESDSTFPSTSAPPIVRVLEMTDPFGQVQQFFHVEYLARAAFESTTIRRKYYDDKLYKRLVPQQQLDTFEKISELQADAGLISRPISSFFMDLWTVPLQWLAMFGGPDEPHGLNTVTEDIVNGTTVIRRIRETNSIMSRLGQLTILMHHYGPDGPKHPYNKNLHAMQSWIRNFHRIGSVEGLVELDYGALSKYAWPDSAGKLLEEGHDVLLRMYRLDDEMEMEDPENYTGLPPAMLEQAADIMRRKYQAAIDVWDSIRRYENAN